MKLSSAFAATLLLLSASSLRAQAVPCDDCPDGITCTSTISASPTTYFRKIIDPGPPVVDTICASTTFTTVTVCTKPDGTSTTVTRTEIVVSCV